MKDFNLVSKNVDDINKYSQEILSNINELKISLTGFLVNQSNKYAYKDAYQYLDVLLKTIDTIENNATKINWTNDDIKENLLKNESEHECSFF